MLTDSPQDTDVTYELDADATLVAVGGAWTRFARENDAPDLEPPGPIGRSLFSFISDPTTAQVYDDLLKRVREHGGAIVFPIRCDAPSTRRYLSITMGPSGKGFSLLSRLVRSEERAPVSLDVADADSQEELIRSCGWCKRIEVDAEWLEIEAAIARLSLFDRPRLPLISHSMCANCQDRMEEILTRGASAGGTLTR